MSYSSWSERHDNAKSVVTDLLKGLSEMNDSPHYSLGYLEAMLTKWAASDDTVFEEIVRTNDWLGQHTKAKEASDAKV